MPIETPWLPGSGIPYCIRGQLCAEDVQALEWMYSHALEGTDTIEIGTAYGGSAFIGARRAKEQNCRHWCIDEFGRPGSLLPGEPSMEITFSSLWATGVHRWAVLVPGTSCEVGWRFTGAQFGAAFIDGNHTAEWGRSDLLFCARAVRTGGFVAAHDLWEPTDKRFYADYSAAVAEFVAEAGWSEVFRAGGTTAWQTGSA